MKHPNQTFIGRWLELKKYHYELFFRALPLHAKIIVLFKKTVSAWRGTGIPQSLEIGVTYHCQLSCEHCGIHGQSRQNATELTLQEIYAILRQASDLGVYFVVFAGAEPLLRKDLPECIAYANDLGMVTGLSTNGLLLTSGYAAVLKQKGLNFINISVDSAIAEVHDALRGSPGIFKKAMEAVQSCVAAGIPVIFSTYATSLNIQNGDLKAIIELARNRSAHGVRILLSIPAGKWLGCKNVILNAQEKQIVKDLLDPLFVYIEGVCNKFTECNAVLKKMLYVSPYGDVQPCCFVPFTTGNIRTEQLKTIWSRMKKHPYLDQFNSSDCIMRQKPQTDTVSSNEAKIS